MNDEILLTEFFENLREIVTDWHQGYHPHSSLGAPKEIIVKITTTKLIYEMVL